MNRQNTHKSSEERAIISICINAFLLISWIHLWEFHIFSNINMYLCIFIILIYILFSCTFIFIYTLLCFSCFFTHFTSYFTFYFIYAHYIINNDNTSVSESPSELPPLDISQQRSRAFIIALSRACWPLTFHFQFYSNSVQFS